MSVLTTKHQRLAALRPLSPESVASLAAAWDVRMVYESNSIEGNSLTLRQTAMVLKEELKHADVPLEDYLATARLLKAWQTTKSLASPPAIVSLSSLLKLYTEALAPAEDLYQGNILDSEERRQKFRTPQPKITQAFTLLLEIDDPVLQAATIHQNIAHLDPFGTGSGRAARLAMNFVLLAAGYPPISIPTELRQEYYAALEAADSGDFPAWLEFLSRQLNQELDQWLEALEISAPDPL